MCIGDDLRLHTIIYSYLFFALFIFNVLALLSSEFMPVFAQVFALLTEDGRIYDIFSCILLFVALLTLCSMPLRIYTQRSIFGRTTPFVVTFVACALFVLLCMLLYWLWGKIFAHDGMAILPNTNAAVPTWQDYYTSLEFFIALACWVCLVILPLLYKALSLTINMGHRIGKPMLILEPSMTTIVIVMSATACHPYFSHLPSRFIHFACFVVASVLLIYVLVRRNTLFGFYEYANTILLTLSIFCFVLCSGSMLRGDFFNAQLTLYILGICSWCSGWVHNQELLSDKIAS